MNFASRTSCRKCGNSKASFSSAPSAKPGDWTCTVCSHLNFARNQSCRSCHTVPALAVARSFAPTSATPPSAKPGDWSCFCGEFNFARNQSCRKCNRAKVTAPAPSSTSDDDGQCVVCMESPAQAAIKVCGHLALCMQCAPTLNTCPMCRAPYTPADLLKIFVATV